MKDLRKHLIEKRDAAIARNGWTVITVNSSKTEMGYTYSIGFEETFKHPEVVFVGIPLDLAQTLIGDIAKGLKDRSIKLPVAGGETAQIIKQFNVLVRPVPEKYARRLARGAFDRRYPKPVRLLQLCIPDTNGVLPDKPWCDPTYIDAQDYKQFEV
jgi:hypothetical protein